MTDRKNVTEQDSGDYLEKATKELSSLLEWESSALEEWNLPEWEWNLPEWEWELSEWDLSSIDWKIDESLLTFHTPEEWDIPDL